MGMNKTRRNTVPINWLHQKRNEAKHALVSKPVVKEITKEELLTEQGAIKSELKNAISLLHELKTRLDVEKQKI